MQTLITTVVCAVFFPRLGTPVSELDVETSGDEACGEGTVPSLTTAGAACCSSERMSDGCRVIGNFGRC